jgi:hypothetical protein
LFHAARFARSTGSPPTLTVTINWDRIGVAEHLASDLFSELRSRTKRRWKYLSACGSDLGRLDDFGSHENPDGHRNTHWTVAIPAAAHDEFKRTVTRLLKKVAKVATLGRALHFRRIDPNGIGSHLKYIAKGVRPDAARYFHMQAVDQGFISGRGRTFVSRSLSFKARKAAGWKRTRRPAGSQFG